MKKGYTVLKKDGFVIINYYGQEWNFKEEGFNCEGMTLEQIVDKVNECLKNNRTK